MRTVKMQRALEVLVELGDNSHARAYRKSNVVSGEPTTAVVLGNDYTFWVSEGGDLVGPFHPTPYDVKAWDWVYEY
jgi:hypothetical protein